jgi:hypothetical protein
MIVTADRSYLHADTEISATSRPLPGARPRPQRLCRAVPLPGTSANSAINQPRPPPAGPQAPARPKIDGSRGPSNCLSGGSPASGFILASDTLLPAETARFSSPPDPPAWSQPSAARPMACRRRRRPLRLDRPGRHPCLRRHRTGIHRSRQPCCESPDLKSQIGDRNPAPANLRSEISNLRSKPRPTPASSPLALQLRPPAGARIKAVRAAPDITSGPWRMVVTPPHRLPGRDERLVVADDCRGRLPTQDITVSGSV